MLELSPKTQTAHKFVCIVARPSVDNNIAVRISYQDDKSPM
jgi:hypothetical protein